MKGNKAKRLNPLLETLGLLYMAENFEAVKAELLSSLEDMDIDSGQFYKQNLSYLESYVREFASACVSGSDDGFFFGHNTEFFLMAAAAAVQLSESGTDAGCLEESHILSVMGDFLREEDSGKGGSGKDIKTLEGWFEALQLSEYSEDTKWRVLELFHDPVGKFRRLFELYERNRAAYDYTCRKNKNHLSRLISDAPEELPAGVRNIAKEFYPEQKKVYLTAVLPLVEWVMPGVIFQGVLADKVDLYRDDLKNAREKLPQILKLLGDKSKFEILCLLKNNGKYNLEIAEELKLTPATASHHMSMLLSNQMVTVEKKDGKVYYRLNQETLKEIAECFEEVFL